MTMLILFVTLLSSCFFYVPEVHGTGNTIGNDILRCASCGTTTGLQQSTLCCHLYCSSCKTFNWTCLICKKDIIFRRYLSCATCGYNSNLVSKFSNVFCQNCKDLVTISQENEASSSRQNDVPNEFINYRPDNEIRNQSTNNHNQDNEGNNTYKIKVTLDSNGNPFYDFLEVDDD
ncbi:uncharacterized protein LOC126897469 isoform X3 [Daktulosphaira vitifoliae]|uniref:uncharacterized protein LOC126897469 isoform X3 n=1 Tax=Daktulosphaira vitifoliae TaxID=58002 RepID=UPI0021AA870F|nr:uncharacterized protein LOC126897469 isoform X3 [Daktulosphaira vitifoliae]